MSESGGAVSHRRRFLAGAVAGGVVMAALCAWAIAGARASAARDRAERTAIVASQALVSVVEAAFATGSEDPGETVRRAVASFAATRSDLVAIRVIEGRELVASTAPSDTGESAAPRNLRMEEKEYFDRAQALRAAIQTNREEGGSRKDEIEVRRLDGGGLGVASPIEKDGEFSGMVGIETAPLPPAPGVGPLWPLLFAFLPAVAILLSWPAGERLLPLAAVALAAGALGVALLVSRAAGTLEADLAATDVAVAAANADAARAASAAGVTVDPEAWDVDRFRAVRPKIAPADAPDVSFLRKVAIGIGLLGAGIVAFFGFGSAARTVAALKRHRAAYAYVAPAMVGMLILVFFPFLYGIALSFTDSTIYTSNQTILETWVGLKNYATILGDFAIFQHTDAGWVPNYGNFYWTLGFTIFWTVTNVAIGVSVGLALALILNTKGLALRPLYRVLLIFPWAMPNYITALIWKGMFHQQFGVVNQVLQIVGLSPIAWFDKPFTSYLTALATNGWLSFPFMMVVSLGALQSIPADLYEAARVDGASRLQQFRSITLPSLKPALVPAIILSVVWTFNMFNIIYLVTGGQPAGSTEILITESYKIAFENYRYGYAAAYSTVIFAILLMYGWFQNRITRATEGV